MPRALSLSPSPVRRARARAARRESHSKTLSRTATELARTKQTESVRRRTEDRTKSSRGNQSRGKLKRNGSAEHKHTNANYNELHEILTEVENAIQFTTFRIRFTRLLSDAECNSLFTFPLSLRRAAIRLEIISIKSNVLREGARERRGTDRERQTRRSR